MSFDVRSKKFDLIKLPQGRATQFTRMIRYNGKVAIMLSGGFQSYPGRIELWVLEDAAKHGWSNQNFVLPLLADRNTMCQVFCVINDDAGEFVLAPETLQKSMRRVDIGGIAEQDLQYWDVDSDRRTISIFPGQVENLMFLYDNLQNIEMIVSLVESRTVFSNSFSTSVTNSIFCSSVVVIYLGGFIDHILCF
ncbi:hypothetical protein IGI04_015882 [Brassica rapa subsp. trilocularis]|uniref:F-box associated beta-propeller type 3 domain-containing protein n=1 Tax=Brassica rapa subsp. trilocularis TaxID=1813537 RepID=A0ABQ7MTW6_BRACM|nr:hypothetical protein IGI04_015882 [Brassica rapa subsp. trilocularis]